MPTWCGSLGEGEARVAPFLELGTLLAGTVEPIPYRRLMTTFDPYLVNGQRTFMKTCWLPAFDSGNIDICIEAMETAASPGLCDLHPRVQGKLTSASLMCPFRGVV